VRLLALALLFFVPITEAKDLLMPEVGVVLVDAPGDLSDPEFKETEHALIASAYLRDASLTIRRMTRPETGARPITDESLQQALVGVSERNHIELSSKTLDNLGGVDSWVLEGVSHPIRGVSFIEFSHTAYIIWDGRLTSISVEATGNPKRPAQFDLLVRALDSLKLQPVASVTTSEALAREHPGQLPRFLAGSDLEYSAYERRMGMEGVVNVSLKIDDRGRAVDPHVVYSNERDFNSHTLAYIRSGRFVIPSDWVETHSHEHVFVMEFQFALIGSTESCPAAKRQPRQGGDSVSLVCGSRLAAR
jgi:Gram-negative bacterial TonB protein C-terminal